MKKLLLSALSLTLILALAGWATDTRVLTLGDANNIVKDEANIFLYPSTINMYRGLVLGDVNSNYYDAVGEALYRVGAHYDFGEGKGVVGLYIDNRPQDIWWAPQQPDPGPNTGIDNRLVLFYGRPFGDTQFGMNLSLHSDSYKSETDGDATEQRNMDLGLQLGLTLQEKLDLAAGFNMLTWTNKDVDGEDIAKPKGNFSFNFDARYWYAFTDEVDFIPHFDFLYHGGGYEITDGDEVKETEMMLDLGWGVNIRPVDRVLLLFDLGINYDTDKEELTPQTGDAVETTTNMMSLPYYKIGLEGHVTKWWDVRLGAVKAWHGHNVKDVSKNGYAMTDTYLGSGFHFGNLTLDAWINPDFVLNGPNFVSGWQGDLAYQASIKYTWK